MKTVSYPLLLALLVLASPAWAKDPAKQEKARRSIQQAEADFEKARAERGLEGWLSFFADDTADFVRGGPFTFTKDEMRKRLQPDFDPADKLTWKPVKIEVAESGELAYSL